MPWTIVNNVHVKVWVASPLGVAPAGAPTYDGPGQLMPPTKPPRPGADAYGPRLVLPASQFTTDVSTFLGDQVATGTYVAIFDDAAALLVGWWLAVDVSLSTRPGLVLGEYVIDGGFVLLEAVGADYLPYAGVAAGGEVFILGSADWNHQVADLALVTVFTPAIAGFYQANFYFTTQVADAGAGLLSFRIDWDDGIAAKSIPGITLIGLSDPVANSEIAFPMWLAAGQPLRIGITGGAPYGAAEWFGRMRIAKL